MRTFVLRARKGPTIAADIQPSIGGENHFEVVASTLVNAIFMSKAIREDVTFHTVLEASPEGPKVVTVRSWELYRIGGFHEAAAVGLFRKALEGSARMVKDETRNIAQGLDVSKMSFERLVRGIAESEPTYLLDRKGDDIRVTDFQEGGGCFLLTDHIPMASATLSLLRRIGVRKISLGPRVLFASQCVTLIHNELDRTIF
ncbi:MAG: tRNA (pseudouridine(54)-N(1))-methyltransferase TrmY [Candidatus Wallbacteria bacterium HGW-Wallbacteria-1]|jgi:tRNA (pseudouridine54-N1)-methyltransferase|uniref:tRNA (Pseudouridine(54)-N(1))-methyltransferase TrmY n=1 Tax=Candidatus Wallbacteria bacterium HGW-Wallbacteria-1 TaxID=2013854 RepID=A0A2N1PUA2_9BACT|nr:MAG: tRNA (pseudouridine(54)-N(1))-methyltransferase TrmY [Candidatus Wallbacteria bacterium HGW-Wallbacteria-1]